MPRARRLLLLVLVGGGVTLGLVGLAGLATQAPFTGTTQSGSDFSAATVDTWLPTAASAARLSSSTCQVSWTAAGGAPAGLTYDVTDGSSTVATGVSGTSTTITVPATAVTPTVRARYGSWISASARTSSSACPLYVPTPDAPTGVTAFGEDQQISTSWTAANDNGTAVTSYTATAVPSGGGPAHTCTTATTACAITGLTNGVGYDVTVTATSAAGTGPASSAVTVTTVKARYWVGAVGGAFTAAANWSRTSGGAGGASAPDATAEVRLSSASGDLTVTGPADVTVQSWMQYAGYTGTVTVATTESGAFQHLVVSGDATIDGGTWTGTTNDATQAYRVRVSVGGDLAIGAGGTIDVTGDGYSANNGPGSAGVGAYGGAGGGGGSGNGPSTNVYGDPYAPADIGSGSGTYPGGGALQLSVAGSATINGTVRSNGQGSWNSGGGSSGGAIHLTAGTLAGNGTISADGGTDGWSGNGGGGRVAVVLSQPGATVPGTVTVTACGGGDGAAAGTVYLQNGSDPARGGTVVIDNRDQYLTPTTIPCGATWTPARLIVRNQGVLGVEPTTTLDLRTTTITGDPGDTVTGIRSHGGTLLLPAAFTIADWALYLDAPAAYTGTWTIASGGRITHSANDNAATYRLDLTLTGNLTVQPGGAVDVVAKGYSSTHGPGRGWIAAGYGGEAEGGTTYGDALAPTDIGSASNGFNGGGAAQLTVSGQTRVDGTLTADGSGSWNSGGASSGGSIWLTTATLTGTGTITSNGGSDGWSGHGGGGRVAVVLTQAHATVPGTLTVTAYGGRDGGSRAAAAGTVYLQNGDDAAGAGTLIVDNGNPADPSTVWTDLDGSSARSLSVGTVVVTGLARFLVGSDDTLTTTGTGTTLTVGPGANLTNAGALALSGVTPSAAGALDFSTAGNAVTYTGQPDNSTVPILPGPYRTLTLDRAGTTFTWPATATTVNGTLTVHAGLLDQSTGDLSASGVVVDAAGTWLDHGTNTITLGATGVSAAGAVDLDGAGGGSGVGTTTSITLASSTPGARRTWIVAAPTAMSNVSVADMGDDGAPQITVTTGADAGGNGTRWAFVP